MEAASGGITQSMYWEGRIGDLSRGYLHNSGPYMGNYDMCKDMEYFSFDYIEPSISETPTYCTVFNLIGTCLPSVCSLNMDSTSLGSLYQAISDNLLTVTSNSEFVTCQTSDPTSTLVGDTCRTLKTMHSYYSKIYNQMTMSYEFNGDIHLPGTCFPIEWTYHLQGSYHKELIFYILCLLLLFMGVITSTYKYRAYQAYKRENAGPSTFANGGERNNSQEMGFPLVDNFNISNGLTYTMLQNLQYLILSRYLQLQAILRKF